MRAKSIVLCLTAACLIAPGAAIAESGERATVGPSGISAIHRVKRWAERVRPYRASREHRYANLSDREVRAIESLTRTVQPGAIVNISEVTLGCPCEDGPSCSDQVSVVAYTEARSRTLLLSRIDGSWEIGPLQSWWLARDALWAQFYREDARTWQTFREYMLLEDRLEERYPACADPEGETTPAVSRSKTDVASRAE